VDRSDFFFEERTLILQFEDAFNDVVVRRINKDRQVQDRISVNFRYSPKERVLHDIVNKNQHLRLPIIACYKTGLRRDTTRVFNKIEGSFWTEPDENGHKHLLQPVPVDLEMGMSVISRYQMDMDQIIANFVPYTDPYVVVSWTLPILGHEIRSHIIWNENISYEYPTDIDKTQPYRVIANTSFTIKGWIFKDPADNAGTIYKIDTSFTSVSDLSDRYDRLIGMMNPDNTETFTISARPQPSLIEPFMTIPSAFPTFTLKGDMFNFVDELYVSGSPGVYPNATLQTPFSTNQGLSAVYPAFTGVEVSSFNVINDSCLTFELPSAAAPGFIDVIPKNDAGYGKLTVDSVRPTLNPFPSAHPGYATYEEWQHPSISGIQVL
jgi:hypothetical protein